MVKLFDNVNTTLYELKKEGTIANPKNFEWLQDKIDDFTAELGIPSDYDIESDEEEDVEEPTMLFCCHGCKKKICKKCVVNLKVPLFYCEELKRDVIVEKVHCKICAEK